MTARTAVPATHAAAAMALIAGGRLRIVDVVCHPDSHDLDYAAGLVDDTCEVTYIARRWICECTPTAATPNCEHTLAMRLVLAPEDVPQ